MVHVSASRSFRGRGHGFGITAQRRMSGRHFAPGAAAWDEANQAWSDLYTDDDARFDRTVQVDATTVEPTVTWGTTPAMSVPVSGRVPRAEESANRD